MAQQRDAVIKKANTSFTRLQEENRNAEQARSHLIGLIGSQQEGDQYVHTLEKRLQKHKLSWLTRKDENTCFKTKQLTSSTDRV
eukprot:6239520-Amphidinium_carterae.1